MNITSWIHHCCHRQIKTKTTAENIGTISHLLLKARDNSAVSDPQEFENHEHKAHDIKKNIIKTFQLHALSLSLKVLGQTIIEFILE